MINLPYPHSRGITVNPFVLISPLRGNYCRQRRLNFFLFGVCYAFNGHPVFSSLRFNIRTFSSKVFVARRFSRRKRLRALINLWLIAFKRYSSTPPASSCATMVFRIAAYAASSECCAVTKALCFLINEWISFINISPFSNLCSGH